MCKIWCISRQNNQYIFSPKRGAQKIMPRIWWRYLSVCLSCMAHYYSACLLCPMNEWIEMNTISSFLPDRKPWTRPRKYHHHYYSFMPWNTLLYYSCHEIQLYFDTLYYDVNILQFIINILPYNICIYCDKIKIHCHIIKIHWILL